MTPRPGVAAVPLLLAGLAAGIAWNPTGPAWLIAGALLGVVGVAVRRLPLARTCALVVLSFSIGSVLGSAWVPDRSMLDDMARDASRCKLEGRVLEQAGKLGTLLSVASARCEGREPFTTGGVVVTDPKRADPGASYVAEGLLTRLRDESFDRARRRLGVNVAFHDKNFRTGTIDSPVHSAAASIRRSLRASVARLDPRHGALLLGLTIGDTSGIDDDTSESLRRAGLSHLLAVSGSNVAIVLGAIAWLTRRRSLPARLFSGATGLGIFVVTVGPEPSVLRAGAMGAVMLVALAHGRSTEPLRALLAALVIVLSARPLLIHSVGLQLSAAATAGIVLWTDPLARRWHHLPRPLALGLAVTVAAQVAVAPLLIGTFGELSVVAPLSNLLALAAVAPATVLGLLAAVVGLVDRASGSALATMASPFAAWIAAVGERLGAPSWSSIQLSTGWAPLAGGVVVVLAAAAWRAKERGQGGGE